MSPATRRRAEPQADLGAAVREARLAAGLTQEDAAHRCGISTAWYARVEGGERDPKWSTVRKLAAGLGLSVAELAARAESRAPRDGRR